MSNLRDKRHVVKFFYSLNQSLFYEPFHNAYVPNSEFKNIVKSIVSEKWEIIRDGIWFHVTYPNCKYIKQGWKIHVSSSLNKASHVLKTVVNILSERVVPFKFALDKNILMTINYKNWYRGSSGKFITIYPNSENACLEILEMLYKKLQGEEGPYILSDRRYKDSKVLYYRYGGIQKVFDIDFSGEKYLVLESPNGEKIRDIRYPYFKIPYWVNDLIPLKKKRKQKAIELNNRYIIKKAFSYSNTGGVYLAYDKIGMKNVVIKEARPFTHMTENGRDAVANLKREYELLNVLQNSNLVPKPYDLFKQWENWFLVEEYLDGINARMLFLRNNPLLRVVPSLRDSKKFFKIYKTIFINFLKGLAEIYSKGIIIGDLSPYNLIIDPETYSLKFIDFENAGKLGCDMAGPLHTPGFSKSQVAEKELSYKDSMYSLGTIMTYLLFPTNVLGLLRSDYYSTIVNQFIDDLGWSPKVYTAIKKSFEGSITINDLSLLLNKAEKEITTSSYDDYVDKKEVIKIVNQLGKFILNNYDTSRIDRLFPADPYLYRTNALSFGFGALGVMYSLKKCNIKLPRDMTLWVEKRIKYINKSDYAPNFLTGLAGISYALWELGYKEYGEKLIIAANRHDLLTKHHSLYYGIAGIGLINLFFFHKTKRNLFLDEAVIMGNYLLESVVNDNRKWFWNGDNNNNITIGFGYGQSGVALFLLRLYQITGDDKYLSMGKKTLSTDISFCKNIEKNVLSFPGSSVNPTLEPYIEEGSGGILKVILRYGNYITYNNLSNTINDIHRKYSVYPGLIFGVGSFIDVLIDAYLYLNETKYLKMAQRPIKGLSDFYLLKYQDSYAVPGDGLYKISCDYATGVAGIMRVLHRYVCPNYSDYLLDEVEI